MRTRPVLARAAVALCLAGGTLVVSSGAPASAETVYDCAAITGQENDVAATEPLKDPDALPDPADQLRLREARRAAGGRDGSGVRVALLDSGVEGAGFPGRALEPPPPALPREPVLYFHGTTAAGLIWEIAPGARILDLPVRVSPPEDAEDRAGTVPEGRVETALRSLLDGHRPGERLVVVMPLEMEAPSVRVRELVARLQERGALVVATTGDRHGGDVASPGPQQYARAENHRAHPAAYPGVIGVSAVPTAGVPAPADLVAGVYASDVTDVAAPTLGAWSRTVQGRRCRVVEAGSSWASAQVGGLLALMWSAEPGASAAEVRTRLLETASGRPEDAGRALFTGAGVVQPYDALTRAVGGERPEPPAAGPVEVVPPEADLLADIRQDAVWWGLLGGGALLLGLVLRPLLSRRRSR